VESDGEFDTAAQARLLAVLGHEVGHLERRHAARVMAGSSLAAAISATLFGDFSGVAAGVPTVLSQMQYSRAMELEADDYALPVLRRNGIPPHTFADVLDRLARANPVEANLPRWLKTTLGYLSTHPGTAARIDRVRAAEASVR
jgi:Zn-dependent protease with chaperone function